MPDALDSVKALAADYRRWAQKSEELGDTKKARRQELNAAQIEAVAVELETARKRLRPIPKGYGDLSDLPEEVMAQLSLAKVDELEQQLRDIVAAADGEEIGLDIIIIELYRRHKVVGERRFIMNKLYRMSQKGIINSVDGKKGVYVLPKPWRSDGDDWGKPSTNGGWGNDLEEDIPF